MILSRPAYRIETSRLVLRCWNPGDAPLLAAAIDVSLDHLRPWMPWAHAEPLPLDARVKLLRGFRAKFDSDADYIYGIFSADEQEVIGGTGLHPRHGEGVLEIGYWIRSDRARQGFATEATAALVRLAFEAHGIARLEIRCDPGNAASNAVAARLGFIREAVLRQQTIGVDGSRRDTVIWSMLADAYPTNDAAEHAIAAYDACGLRIL